MYKILPLIGAIMTSIFAIEEANSLEERINLEQHYEALTPDVKTQIKRRHDHYEKRIPNIIYQLKPQERERERERASRKCVGYWDW